MKPILISIILAIFFAIGNISTSIAQSPEQLYQKGLMKEEGEGALQDAISLYNKVADNSNASISLRAKALLHIGMCFEKLGTNEAVKAYQRLVTNFPAQKNEVAIARERLSRLMTTGTSREIAIRQVWSCPEKHIFGKPSPDDRYLSYTDYYTGNLAIYEIATGKKRILTKQGSWDSDQVQYAENSIWSPDGKKIAYDWQNEKGFIEIHIIGIDDSNPRILYKDEAVLWAQSYDWSADGKQILACFERKDRTRQIVLVSAENGTVHTLKTLAGKKWPAWPWNMCFSPDDRYFVYDYPPEDNSSDRDIFLMSTDGGSDIALVKHPAFESVLGWTPDGKNILITSDRRGRTDTWCVHLSDGKPQGDAELLKLDIGQQFQPIGFTQKGSFYYTKKGGRNSEINIATLDQETGKILAPWTKPITRFTGSNRCPTYSPDGKYFSYVYGKPDLPPFPNILFIHSLETGMEREFSTNLKRIAEHIWYPDCSSILCRGQDEKNRTGIYQIDTQTGIIAPVVPPLSETIVYPIRWSRDGKSFFMGRYSQTNNFCQLVLREIQSGTEKEIYHTSYDDLLYQGFPVLCCSPDGKWISFANRKEKSVLRIMLTTGGEVRELHKFEQEDYNIGQLEWSPDGKYIFTVLVQPKQKKCSLWRITTEGGEAQKLLEMNNSPWPFAHLSVHPDGQHIVFQSVSNPENAEVWVVENLLPLEKLAQKKEKEDLLVRKVLPDAPSEPLGTPSPDGRYISFVDWDSGGNIGILDLENKEKRRLTNFKNPDEQAYYSSWSPDGKQIAYFWWALDKDQYNLSIVNVKDSKSRDLLKSDKIDWIELGNWSSNGRYILATLSLRGKPESQIVRISTVDGSVQILKTFNISYLGGKPYLSPDGRYVAYDLPDDKASANSDIYIYSIEDGSENALFKHPAHDYILGWIPDGKNILFASDRTGTVDAMIIGVEDGKSIDQPKPVKSNIGPIVPMGFTQEGSFYYGQWPEVRDIYSAEIDFEEGKILTQPAIAIRRFEGKNHAPSYSNDGKHLAYISNRGVIRKGESGIVLCIRDLETGEESEIIPDTEISKRIRRPQWSPDDRSIAMTCDNPEGYSRIYNYDIQTRKFTPLVTESNVHLTDVSYCFPLWLKDGRSIYYLQISKNFQISRIMVRNISTGAEKELYQYSSNDFYDRFFDISLSPDGKWLAAVNRSENRVLRVIPTEGGITRDLYSFKWAGEFECPQIWSKDGKYIIFPYQKQLGSGEWEWNLMRIPFEGGENLSIKMNILGIGSPSLHPNGRTLSFGSRGYSPPENNIWVMENFLPKQ